MVSSKHDGQEAELVLTLAWNTAEYQNHMMAGVGVELQRHLVQSPAKRE